MFDDSELLRRYAQNRSEEAFSELVRRHLDFVYGVALRHVRNDTHLARDVCQEVFTALARKAERVSRQGLLMGWLHTAARYSASRAVRGEQRRRAREQEACTMHELNDDSGLRQPWHQMRPLIDEVLGKLRERDREAVLLRYFDELTFAQVGERLRISEDAARLRVSRALDELSRRLARRGVDSTAAAVAACLGSQAAIAAPVGWAAPIAGTAMAVVRAGWWVGMLTSVTPTKIVVGGAVALAVVSAAWLQVERAPNPGKESSHPTHPISLVAPPQPLFQTAVEPRVADPVQRAPVPESHDARPSAPVVPAAAKRAWSNGGRNTPEAALETLFYAGANGDAEMIVSGIELIPQMSVKLTSQVPVAERGEPNAGERLLAQMLIVSTESVKDMQIVGRSDPDAGTVILRVRLESVGGEVRDRDFTFRKTDDGWRMLIDGS